MSKVAVKKRAGPGAGAELAKKKIKTAEVQSICCLAYRQKSVPGCRWAD